VVSGQNAQNGGKDYSLEGLFRIHRRHSGSFPLRDLSGQERSFAYRLSLLPVRMPPKPIAMAEMPWYDRKEVHAYFSSRQNFNPVPDQYKERFDSLLVEFGGGLDATVEDLQALSARSDIPPTTRAALVQARVGQGKFRSDVTSLWGKGEVCALTGIDVPELLIASHVKPWRDSSDEERLDACNGLLLATHVDKVFDRYLLSFREERGDFGVSIHPRAEAALRKTGVTRTMKLTTSHMSPSDGRRFSSYLRQHHQIHLELIAKDQPTG
jgi:HNH endonuclease